MENFYCLSSDGELYALGKHSDWEAAENTAQTLVDPVWVFGEASFNSWLNTLNKFKKNGF